MKNFLKIIGVLSFLFLVSCSTKSTNEKELESEKWELVEMSGQMANSTRTGAEMSWQEYYLLNSDSTFSKFRKQNGEALQAEGTYSYLDLADGKYLELTYPSKNVLIGNCVEEHIETLRVEGNKLMGTWQMCDGPGLIYEKID